MYKSILIFMLIFFSYSFSDKLVINSLNSPYIIDSTIVVDTLIVERNSTILFKADATIHIKKFIYSVGTLTMPIKYTSGKESPSSFDWNGILIHKEAEAFFIHNKFKNCIECIVSKTENIAIDSTEFTDFGENIVIIKDKSIHAGDRTTFSYNKSKWEAYLRSLETDKDTTSVQEKSKIRPWMWIAAGVVGASVPLVYWVTRPDKSTEEPEPEPEPQKDKIKYPNFPDWP